MGCGEAEGPSTRVSCHILDCIYGYIGMFRRISRSLAAATEESKIDNAMTEANRGDRGTRSIRLGFGGVVG